MLVNNQPVLSASRPHNCPTPRAFLLRSILWNQVSVDGRGCPSIVAQAMNTGISIDSELGRLEISQHFLYAFVVLRPAVILHRRHIEEDAIGSFGIKGSRICRIA